MGVVNLLFYLFQDSVSQSRAMHVCCFFQLLVLRPRTPRDTVSVDSQQLCLKNCLPQLRLRDSVSGCVLEKQSLRLGFTRTGFSDGEVESGRSLGG